MRKAIACALVLTLVASGCAAHRVPGPGWLAATSPSEWASAEAIPPGTFVQVTADGTGEIRGVVRGVTVTALTLRNSLGLYRISRNDVERVAMQVQVGTRDTAPWYVGYPIAGAILGGLAGILVSAVARNKPAARTSAWVLVGGLATGLCAGVFYPVEGKFEERLIYQRRSVDPS